MYVVVVVQDWDYLCVDFWVCGDDFVVMQEIGVVCVVFDEVVGFGDQQVVCCYVLYVDVLFEECVEVVGCDVCEIECCCVWMVQVCVGLCYFGEEVCVGVEVVFFVEWEVCVDQCVCQVVVVVDVDVVVVQVCVVVVGGCEQVVFVWIVDDGLCDDVFVFECD